MESTLCELPYPRLRSAEIYKLMDGKIGSVLDLQWTEGMGVASFPSPIEYIAWHVVREKYDCK